jgi:ATP/maltotriose-dependent transcriptional regulator MalT
VEEATDFLREALADGPRASKEIWQQAEERGISYATLRRGQARLGIIKRPAGFGKPWLLEFRRVQQQDSPELLNADP